MKQALASLHTLLPGAAGDAPPEWIHVLPAGTFSGTDGRGPYKLGDPAAVIAASMALGRLPIDENHATDLAAPAGRPSPAKGWIVALKMREPDAQGQGGGIWAQIEWNEAGRALMADRAYRAFSPVFEHDGKTGEVGRLLRAALTNTPNLTQLATLHAQQDPQMDLPALRLALGLAETATEAEILAAATAGRTATVSLQSQQTEASKLAATVVSLQTQLDTMKVEQGRSAAVAAVDGAIKAGKPIAALRDHYVTRHQADPAGVAAELAALPSINAGGVVLNAKADPDAAGELTEEDRMPAHGPGPEEIRRTQEETR